MNNPCRPLMSQKPSSSRPNALCRIKCHGCGQFFAAQHSSLSQCIVGSSGLTKHVRSSDQCFELFNDHGWFSDKGSPTKKQKVDFQKMPIEFENKFLSPNSTWPIAPKSRRESHKIAQHQLNCVVLGFGDGVCLSDTKEASPGNNLADEQTFHVTTSDPHPITHHNPCSLQGNSDDSVTSQFFGASSDPNGCHSICSNNFSPPTFFDDNSLSKSSHSSCFNLITQVPQTINFTSSSPTHDVFSISEPRTICSMSGRLHAEVKLLHLMLCHKVPLLLFEKIFSWAITSSTDKSFSFDRITPRSRTAILDELKNVHSIPDHNSFEVQMIPRWLPDKNPVHVQVRSFQTALKSLFSKSHFFKESNLSLPNVKTPFSAVNDPPINVFSELHHGSWWRDTMSQKCHGPNDMLVPVILYMDSVSIDQRGKLSLTPLNMTLGIFSTRARKQPEAWETLYFHPDNSFMSSKQFRKTPSASLAAKHNIINLHSGLRVALSSLKMAIDGNGFLCHNFPWAGKKWSVQMKFSIAFVIGDTELHDKLCT